jgi:glutamyl-tRNA reductase
MNFFVAGLSYRTAPVEVRERLSVQASWLRCQGCKLKIAGGLKEVVVVSTCNRVEIYGVGEWMSYRVHKLFDLLCGSTADLNQYLYYKEGAEAAEHLFSVAGGLDSMVLGETEITGQIKNAYLAAQEAKLTGKITNRIFQTALQVAKEIRTGTAVGRGSTSVGSVAVDLAERIFEHDLSQKTVMIIGAGKMGEACLRHLSKKGAGSVLVANRSHDRAVALASEFGGRAVSFGDRFAAMAEADIVVSSTGASETILARSDLEKVMALRQDRPLFLVDIAVPRDIDADVQQLPNVFLYNVDHLEEIVRENLKLREREIDICRQIVARRASACMARLYELPGRGEARSPGAGLQCPEFALGNAA